MLDSNKNIYVQCPTEIYTPNYLYLLLKLRWSNPVFFITPTRLKTKTVCLFTLQVHKSQVGNKFNKLTFY